MAHVVAEVKPMVWTEKQAKQSGRTAYRIKVELSGNPFSGSLGVAWTAGYKDAQASDTLTPKFRQREERPPYERRPRPQSRDSR